MHVCVRVYACVCVGGGGGGAEDNTVECSRIYNVCICIRYFP